MRTSMTPCDAVLDCRWTQDFRAWNYPEWRELLEAAMPEAETSAIRLATHTGAPLGSQEFLTVLEKRQGRRLQVLPRGRPRRQCVAQAVPCVQPCLLEAGE